MDRCLALSKFVQPGSKVASISKPSQIALHPIQFCSAPSFTQVSIFWMSQSTSIASFFGIKE